MMLGLPVRRTGPVWRLLARRCSAQSSQRPRRRLPDGPALQHFLGESPAAPQLKSAPPGARRVLLETYGCQMNVSDTAVARAVLAEAGYVHARGPADADAVLLVTCAIREGAETKIRRRLQELRAARRRRPLLLGVLGCMAERLKGRLLEEEKSVDIVCGPDAYRDLPQLLADAEAGHKGVNVQLSLEETYADIVPVRQCPDAPSAYVSIMRGCDNMCTFCVVPFTRGRERSRPIASILEEVHRLVDEGVKEVVLLGQNVNSYRDLSDGADRTSVTRLADGFRTVYKPKVGGRRFAELLERVSSVDGELRVRFTSPHPKDFPDDLLHLIAELPNVCASLHLPAQSGATATLARMGRGYSREDYLRLVERARGLVPRLALSSDFIAGFCGETEAEHEQTLSLMAAVRYNFAFCFPYSQRERTRAARRLQDDVPAEVKARRHEELTAEFRRGAAALNAEEVGRRHLVLVEGPSRRSQADLCGRNDANTKVVFPLRALPGPEGPREPRPGDYVEVEVEATTSQTLRAQPVALSSVAAFARRGE